MVNWGNYDDVLRQLRAAGLEVDSLVVGTRKRCRVDGDREKRGWYYLHELRLESGDHLLVGSYGVWRGNDPGSQRVDLPKASAPLVTVEQRAALNARIAADRKAEEASRRTEAARAAGQAQAMWRRLATDGESDYLQRKCVQAHGLRYSPSGALVVPMLDTAGQIHGLHIIYPSGHPRRKRLGRDKDFWPVGVAKQGHMFLLGSPAVGPCCLIAEGYATAASLFEATGLPVAVAFDAGNIVHVAKALRSRYRGLRLLVCADDDYLAKCRECGGLTLTEVATCAHCGKPHRQTNAGMSGAAAAALAVDGTVVAPMFATQRPLDTKGHTDWNDLHVHEGLQVVRAQIEARISALKWRGRPQAAPTHPSRGEGDGADARTDELRPVGMLADLFDRYALVYEAGNMVFDAQEHALVSIEAMRNLCTSRQLHRGWMESSAKRVVRMREVGFDPGGSDPDIRCNLWGGWPTLPAPGVCDRLLDLAEYLCSNDSNAADMFRWLMCWLAYPVQHPGAKMKTAVIMHGPQGTGKSLFFEAVLAMYGEYGMLVDQDAIEDKHNDWMSKKMLIVADEVVARSEMFHIKNKLKGLITSDWLRINPKHLASYRERNHCQVVFLSNEVMPAAIERDDRRHAVIWTPPKYDASLYNAVLAELRSGGMAALHHHLLTLDLGEFGPATLPPMTQAKRDLIEMGLDSSERFFSEWVNGYLGLLRQSCRSEDLYQGYRHWCSLNGVSKPAQLSTFVGTVGKRPGVVKRRCQHWKNHSRTVEMQSVVITPPGQQPPDPTQPGWKDTLSALLVGFAEKLKTWREEHLAMAPSKDRALRGGGSTPPDGVPTSGAGDDDAPW